MERYEHLKIESKWRTQWDAARVYATTEDPDKQKFYILDMFPYPSGVGLHVGHPKGYIATDVISRYKRMNGFNVLHPMGWDAFGLPAEQYALKNKVHPRIATDENIARYKRQLEKISLNYDWDREISTTDPSFYKWTQWAFIQMFKKGLVFQSNEPINWCPSCKTGLANEDLENGACERCGTPIEKKKIPQWVIKITDYADRLLTDLDTLEWQEHIKELQRNWIGRSEGAKITFKIKDSTEIVTVFTTRPDTLFGATYMVLAPEHSLVEKLKVQGLKNVKEVEIYQKETQAKTEIERTTEGREKTGVKLDGVMAINPANGAEIPVYIADYVLADYGTGAIMAVPAHDERDWAFAKRYNIPIIKTIERTESVVVVITRALKRSFFEAVGKFATIREHGGLSIVYADDVDQVFACAKNVFESDTCYIHSEGPIKRVMFHHHDVCKVFNWKEAVQYEEAKQYGKSIGIVEEQLDWAGAYEAMTELGVLVNANEFDGMKSEDAKKAITEKVGGEMTVNYKLRDWVFSRQRYWGEPIPLIHCKKCGVVPVPDEELPLTLPDVESYEPTGTGESPLAAITDWVNTTCPTCGGAAKRETNTMPQWAGSSWYHLRYIDPTNNDVLIDKEKEKYWSPVDFYVGGAEHATRHLIYARFWHKFLYDIGAVSTNEPYKKLQTVGLIMAEDGRKMSKRWGNVINPDDVIDRFGSDTFRLYEMFMGPFEASVAWSTDSLIGPRKFIERVWKFAGNGFADTTASHIEKELHKTIKKVGEDIDMMKYNTAIAQMMTLLNVMEKEKSMTADDFAKLLKILSPFCPHVTQELWSQMGHDTFILQEQWPQYDAQKIVDEEITLVVQINGKVRDQIIVSADISEDDAKAQALTSKKIQRYTDGKEPKKVIYVKGKLVSIVV